MTDLSLAQRCEIARAVTGTPFVPGTLEESGYQPIIDKTGYMPAWRPNFVGGLTTRSQALALVEYVCKWVKSRKESPGRTMQSDLDDIKAPISWMRAQNRLCELVAAGDVHGIESLCFELLQGVVDE